MKRTLKIRPFWCEFGRRELGGLRWFIIRESRYTFNHVLVHRDHHLVPFIRSSMTYSIYSRNPLCSFLGSLNQSFFHNLRIRSFRFNMVYLCKETIVMYGKTRRDYVQFPLLRRLEIDNMSRDYVIYYKTPKEVRYSFP